MYVHTCIQYIYIYIYIYVYIHIYTQAYLVQNTEADAMCVVKQMETSMMDQKDRNLAVKEARVCVYIYIHIMDI